MPAKFNGFNRASTIRLRDEIQVLLNKYGQETGVDFVFGKVTFGPSNVTMKLEAKTAGAVTLVEQKRESAISRVAAQNGLSLEVINGRQLIGYESRKYKYPFIYKEIQTGKMYKCGMGHAQSYFGTSATRKFA